MDLYSKVMLSIARNNCYRFIKINFIKPLVSLTYLNWCKASNYYRNNGYIISRAILPPQKIQNGVVKIQIIEGYLDEVNVSGDPKWAKCILKAYGKQIAACRPLQLKRMEHYLLIAN